jgi:hypothetical protein
MNSVQEKKLRMEIYAESGRTLIIDLLYRSVSRTFFPGFTGNGTTQDYPGKEQGYEISHCQQENQL